jgi:hypothetical protein
MLRPKWTDAASVTARCCDLNGRGALLNALAQCPQRTRCTPQCIGSMSTPGSVRSSMHEHRVLSGCCSLLSGLALRPQRTGCAPHWTGAASTMDTAHSSMAWITVKTPGSMKIFQKIFFAMDHLRHQAEDARQIQHGSICRFALIFANNANCSWQDRRISALNIFQETREHIPRLVSTTSILSERMRIEQRPRSLILPNNFSRSLS